MPLDEKRGSRHYEYQDTDPLYSQDRAYLDYMQDGNIIYPSLRQHSALANVRQELTRGVTLGVEALFLDRQSDRLTFDSDERLEGALHSRIFSIAPRVDAELPSQWQLSIVGTYGEDQTKNRAVTFVSGTDIYDHSTCYCNSEVSAEANAQGSLFTLPAGELRVAIGGGYRRNQYDSRTKNRLADSFHEERDHQSSDYEFIEASLPLVSSAMQVAAVRTLTATLAARHEHYPEFGSITTPKLGLIYEPVSGLTLKGSWGRSFKAPTLSQQLSTLSLALGPAWALGATGYPADATVIVAQGGNGGLKPERARTWAGTVVLEPRFAPTLKIEATYFDTDYRDRIVSPLDSVLGRVYAEPAYAQFLVRDPSQEEVADLVAAAGGIASNQAGAPYDPTKVIGIAYDTYLNIAREHARGVDLDASLQWHLAGGDVTTSGSASWLHLDKRIAPGTGTLDITGYSFSPPKFRARGNFAWSKGPVSLAVSVNYIGKLVDNQEPVVATRDSFATADLTAAYRLPRGSAPLSGLELGLTVSNLFNRHPPLRTPSADYVVNFDSTNYTAIGRVITGSITKRW